MNRRNILFNDNWTFVKDGCEEVISLPHTWNAIDGQSQADYYRGECVYEKKFVCPEITPIERVYIEFRGVNSSSAVYVNDKKVTAHDGGYSTFRADITELLEEENTIRVLVDNSVNDRVYPQRADFTFYGGIYRDVYLLVVNENHFDLDYFGGNGFLITPNLEGDKATVDFAAYYTGTADSISVEIEGAGKAELAVSENKATGSIVIENVHRWDGLEDPYLYTAKAQLIAGGTIADEVTDRFGCREYYVDPERGFFLNGRSYPLHGVSRHQDRLGVGNALTKEMHKEDMDLILSMGANSIRLAHYQHDQYFYDLCDALGVIAWAEIPYITVHMDGGRENTISQMKELIAQNYNHASIIFWALSNEITLQGVTENVIENHKILNDLVHKMDPKRLSAMANLFLLETDSPLVSLPDIRGYNLYYGWYVGEMEDNDAWFDDFHRQYPNVAIGLTEYGADSVINLQSPKPEKGDYTESYQAIYHEHMLEMLSVRPYSWGSYCWNMFEFAAAGRDEAGDPGKNHKGLITFDRKKKKDAYYIYKAWWADEPFVHLCGSRYHDRIEEETEIKVYSNQKQVALFVDGKEVGSQTGEHVFRWKVRISGVHLIEAMSGDCRDKMEIAKVSEPNPSYFVSADKVKNWFDELEVQTAEEGFLSLDSTMAEIQATEAGKALLDSMMQRMQANTAGGMGKNVKIPKAMMAIVARQSMKKLLVQGGIDLEGEQAKQLAAALERIPKNNK
ncbi:glycoside hydrolase family 2 protein [Lachnoclostridium sp. Marseille-P6806]|uniref:glycoside hydrolase family 2 protein n=1 Tax=Lachnoclostridium sp. Marseille-P6806 TaxID=2364793 RepID=UPI00102F5176|nr:glycoside hydrolase family 2 TIM barrel-domain containing protein [Lachnoclostridium sp. Marseille-P6806]